MNMQDKIQLSTWLKCGASLAEVDAVSSTGIVGNTRFSEQARRAYRLIWAWGAPRFSGSAGFSQERYYRKCGLEAVNRRIERARRLADRMAGK